MSLFISESKLMESKFHLHHLGPLITDKPGEVSVVLFPFLMLLFVHSILPTTRQFTDHFLSPIHGQVKKGEQVRKLYQSVRLLQKNRTCRICIHREKFKEFACSILETSKSENDRPGQKEETQGGIVIVARV